jgi:transcriptional repressor NrdR
MKCGSEETKVLESRLSNDRKSIRRRRICRNCDRRYTTYEQEEALVFHIKKKDGHIESFQKGKALRSIQIACQKRNISIEEAEFMLGKVELALQEMGERIISSHLVGQLIMENLYDLDKVAYVRFASVYKDFKDPSEFQSILKSLK